MRIKDRRLGISYAVAVFLIFCYIGIYVILLQQGYRVPTAAEGTGRIQVRNDYEQNRVHSTVNLHVPFSLDSCKLRSPQFATESRLGRTVIACRAASTTKVIVFILILNKVRTIP